MEKAVPARETAIAAVGMLPPRCPRAEQRHQHEPPSGAARSPCYRPRAIAARSLSLAALRPRGPPRFPNGCRPVRSTSKLVRLMGDQGQRRQQLPWLPSPGEMANTCRREQSFDFVSWDVGGVDWITLQHPLRLRITFRNWRVRRLQRTLAAALPERHKRELQTQMNDK